MLSERETFEDWYHGVQGESLGEKHFIASYDPEATEQMAWAAWQAALATPAAAAAPRESPKSGDIEGAWVDYEPVYEFATAHKLSFNEVAAMVRRAALATPAAEPAISGTKQAMMASKRRFYIGTAQRGPYLAGIEDAILALRTGDKP